MNINNLGSMSNLRLEYLNSDSNNFSLENFKNITSK